MHFAPAPIALIATVAFTWCHLASAGKEAGTELRERCWKFEWKDLGEDKPVEVPARNCMRGADRDACLLVTGREGVAESGRLPRVGMAQTKVGLGKEAIEGIYPDTPHQTPSLAVFERAGSMERFTLKKVRFHIALYGRGKTFDEMSLPAFYVVLPADDTKWIKVDCSEIPRKAMKIRRLFRGPGTRGIEVIVDFSEWCAMDATMPACSPILKYSFGSGHPDPEGEYLARYLTNGLDICADVRRDSPRW